MKELLKKLLTLDGTIHKYVYLRKDEKGFYIEYAFCEGAPHDNRCLDWYHSYQEEAYIRNKWTEGLTEKDAKEYLASIKARIDSKVGKLYRLYDYTCGGEENPEDQIRRHKESHDKWHPGEPWVPEDCVCKVGCPAKACNKTHWTKEQPVKCACWYLSPIEDIEKISFHFNIKTIQNLLNECSESSE